MASSFENMSAGGNLREFLKQTNNWSEQSVRFPNRIPMILRDFTMDNHANDPVYLGATSHRESGGNLMYRIDYTGATGPVTGVIYITVPANPPNPATVVTIDDFTDYRGAGNGGYIEFNCGSNNTQPTGTFQYVISDSDGSTGAQPEPAGNWPPL